MTEILFPKMTGDASEPGVVSTWYVEDGEQVAEKHLRLGDKQLVQLFPALPHKGLGFALMRS